MVAFAAIMRALVYWTLKVDDGHTLNIGDRELHAKPHTRQ